MPEVAGATVRMPPPLPRARPVVRRPAAAVGSEQQPDDCTRVASIAVHADAGAADRAQSATLRKGV